MDNIPKKSCRGKFADVLVDATAEEIMDIEGKKYIHICVCGISITNNFLLEIECDDDAVDAVLDELADNLSVMKCRRRFYSTIAKPDIWRNNILTS